MATGHRNSSGVELDTLFMAGNSGLTTGFRRSDGVDLGSLFQAYVQGAKVATTGFRNSSNVDFADLFQNINVPLFTLTSPTPGGTVSFTSAFGVSYSYLGANADGWITHRGGNHTAFGSPTGSGVANGKYFRWGYVSGTSPTYTNMTAGQWYPCNGTAYVGHQKSASNGQVSGTIYLQFADDGSANGATLTGNWTITAIWSNI